MAATTKQKRSTKESRKSNEIFWVPVNPEIQEAEHLLRALNQQNERGGLVP